MHGGREISFWHAALDARAWTDLISNVTTLRPPAPEDDPRPWLGWGEAGADELSVFLHEATHHWCFTSPVAFTIAGLVLRARMNVVRYVNGEHDVETAIINDLVRTETAVALLRPFAEGLALFAEFDAITRARSKALSPILQSLFQFFVAPQRAADLMNELPPELANTVAVAEVLGALRTNPETIERKASLLLKPFAAAAGGYLPGYLAVKSLWRAALPKHPRLAGETDTFLMFLRSFLYDDWGLVGILLSTEDDELRSSEAIVRHVSGRLDQWDALTASNFLDYEESLAANEETDRRRAILIDDPTHAAGRKAVDALANELKRAARSDDRTDAIVASWNVAVFQRRQFMTLIAAPVTLGSVTENGVEVYWQGNLVCTAKQADFAVAAEEVRGALELEVVFSFRGDLFDRSVIVHDRGRVILCKPLGLEEHADETRREMIRSFRDRAMVMKAEESMRAVVDQVVDQTWFRIAVTHCRTQIDNLADEFLKDIALRFARDYDAVDACAVAMEQRGLKPLLGKSQLVFGLAALGLAISLNPGEDVVEQLLANHGIDLRQTLAGLEDAWDNHGYPPPVMRLGDQLFSCI